MPARLLEVRRTLFYATDKDPRQLEAVNELCVIVASGLIRSPRPRRVEVVFSTTLDAFAPGVLHALTAKRVLDEGINVPQIDSAYILASTTVA